MRVILAEMAASLDTLKSSGCLVSEVMRDLTDTQRKVPVRSRTVRVDPHMVRAVHRAKHVLLVLYLHGREHVVLVVIPVAGCLIQIDRSDTGSHDVQIAQAAFLLLDIILKDLPQRIALRQEHRKALSYQIIRHEELHLLADLSVIAGSCLFLLNLPGFQLFAVMESNAIDAGQHLVLAVILPVSSGLSGNLECLQSLGVGEVGADTHIDIIALLIECDPRILSKISDMLDLINLSSVFHQLDRFRTGKFECLDRQILFGDLRHLGFDRSQILIREFLSVQIHVIIESALCSRTVGKLGLRVKTLYRLCHNMRSSMSDNVSFFLCRENLHLSVIIECFHW